MNTYYILTYKTKPNFNTIKKPYQAEHLRIMQEHYKKNTLIMAGAVLNPSDGGMLIFKGDDPSVAENFANNDPYVTNGIVEKWFVRAWQVVIGY